MVQPGLERRLPDPSAAGAELGVCSLIERAKAGDPQAQAALWQSNQRWVAVVLLAHKPVTVDLDDLMQDVAITLLSRLGDLRDEEGFRGWLRAVAVNAARAAARRAGIRRAGSLDGALEPSTASDLPPGQGRHLAQDDGRHLLRLSMRLTEEYREPLLLKSLHGMSYRQIGLLLDLPETTVETRITRARRMLRELAAPASRTEQPPPETPPEPCPAPSRDSSLERRTPAKCALHTQAPTSAVPKP
jgi:RNA polymerase sigma-70 factor (ECF subfamily)